MKSRIQVLDQQSINQISAGEVVERPLSVVKELVENALDADADKIEISVEGGGSPFIRVKDNGCGMQSEDLKLAFLPHATSKIRTIEDLDRLRTLGFRGEALPSIASVSKMSIVSRPYNEISGYEIQIEGGAILSLTETGCPPGTTVTVKDLFYNTPARRKFLRSNSTEFGLISDMVSRLAFARPDVSFSLRHPDNLLLNTPGKGNLLETIAVVLGNDTARKMLEVTYQDEKLKINGFISAPDLIKSTSNAINFMVNGRVIRSQTLNQALKEGYYTLIHAGTYPVSVLSLTMEPLEYDVNVHPAKLEIKFKEEKSLIEKIAKVIRETLVKGNPIREVSLSSKSKSDNSISAPNLISNSNYNGYNLDKKDITQLSLLKLEDHNIERYPAGKQEGVQAGDTLLKRKVEAPELIAESIDTNYSGDTLDFQELRALGQLFNTYVLCTDEKNLYIIDQHAAHERIKYDKLWTDFNNQAISSQLLLVPETVELSLQEESILLERFAELREMGFIVEHFGERTYFLRGVPLLQNLENPGKIFRNFLEEISSGNITPKPDKLLEEWIFMLACRSAIKSREYLSIQEMDELIQQLGLAINPYTCPHGRPTIIKFSKNELDKRFYR